MIGRLLSHVQKLKGRSSHELYSRVSQRAYAWSERAALHFGKGSNFGPRVDAHTFVRPFFPGITNAELTVQALRARLPLDETEVMARADAIANGSVPLLGYGSVKIGQSPNWQHDPFANLSAPLRHWSTIPYLDPAVVGDHKTVWEISRHQYFVTLGQAWRYSRDERWPKAFTHYLQSWLENNPASVGMNWASSLEVSYRAISWIWAMQLMHDATVVTDELKTQTLKSLQAHGRHLERYLSTYFSPNTHLTGEALGLFYIGTQCPELPQAKRWRDLGARILESSLAQQVLPDGVYFEQATQYHRYTIDIYLHYLLLAQSAEFSVSPNVKSALQHLFDVLLHLTRADGSIPLIGDDDGGRLVQLDDRLPHDVRSLLATGAVVLNRRDLAWMGRGDDAALCWTLGAHTRAERDALVDQPPNELARAFVDGGVYVMRDSWDATAGHAVIDAGPHGALRYGQSHADALAVVLSIGGRPLFVDSGTYTYVGAERDAFRSTTAHNTVEIDGISTSVPGSAFRWRTVSHPSVSTFTTEPEFTCFTGHHSGYASLPSPLEHERAVLQLTPGLWIVRDSLNSRGTHDAVVRWHCATGIQASNLATEAGFSVVSLTEADAERAVLVTMGGLNGAMSLEAAFVSEQFGHKSPATVCTWREKTIGNAVLASVVIDSGRYAVDWDATVRIRSEVQGARGIVVLRVTNGAVHENMLVLVGCREPMIFHELRVTADIVCIQLDAATGKPLAITAVGVTNASNNGITFVHTAAAKQWVVCSNANARSEDPWQVRSGLMTEPRAHVVGSQRSSTSVLSTV